MDSLTKNPIDLVVSLVLYRPNLDYLRETLKSLQNSPIRLKIVIADNSSSPLPVNFLKEFTDIEYTQTGKNLGYGRAHNLNIERFCSHAPYFLILNPDIYFDSQLLGEMLKRLSLDSKIGLAIPRICHPDGGLQLINRRLPRPQDYVMNFINNKLKRRILSSESYQKYLLNDINIEKSFICPTISGCFMLFRSSVLQQVGGFDKRYFLYLEDTDLSRRVAKTHLTVVFSDLVAHHYWSRGAYKSPKLFLLFVSNLSRYFNKWGWIWDHERDQLNNKVSYYS